MNIIEWYVERQKKGYEKEGLEVKDEEVFNNAMKREFYWKALFYVLLLAILVIGFW